MLGLFLVDFGHRFFIKLIEFIFGGVDKFAVGLFINHLTNLAKELFGF